MHRLTCFFPILGNASIDIADKALADFVKRQLTHYVISDTYQNKGSSNSIVSIMAESAHWGIDVCDFLKLGRDFVFKDNMLHIVQDSRTHRLDYRYRFDRQTRMDVALRKKLAYFIKHLFASGYTKHHALFYQTILFPLFNLYALAGNYRLVHGSLIQAENKYIVLTGLDGVGKSTLANALVRTGAKVLADNFVLYNGQSFFGLQMPVRINTGEYAEKPPIYEDKRLKEVLYTSTLDRPVNVQEVYFMTISNTLRKKRVDSRMVLDNWDTINNGAVEIASANRHNLPFLYLKLLKDSAKLTPDAIAFYHLSVPIGQIPDAVKEVIL